MSVLQTMVKNARLYRRIARMPSTPARLVRPMLARAVECMHCARVIKGNAS